MNTFEKNYCEGHRHTPHALGDPSGNEFAAEALDTWAETLVDLMIKLREIERNAVKLQREQLLAKLRQVQESGTERGK